MLKDLRILAGTLSFLKGRVDVLHIGTCVMNFCPRREDLLKAIREKRP
ncbi:MAG: hypothetical protein ACK401_04670 [Archaeoglobaceae archaeon]